MRPRLHSRGPLIKVDAWTPQTQAARSNSL